MPQSKEQLFNDVVQFVTQYGLGVIHTRDPRQDVPPECGCIRVRLPGEAIFTSVGIVQFRTFSSSFALRSASRHSHWRILSSRFLVAGDTCVTSGL